MGDLLAIIEQTTGIDVAVLESGSDEHGLTARTKDEAKTFIVVARTKHPMRQRSTLAHELGHVVFNDWQDMDESPLTERPAREIRADAFARHLLLPQDGVRQMLGSKTWLSEADLSRIVQLFGASPVITAIALEQYGFIDDVQKREWMALSTSQLATRHGWMDYYRTLQDDSNRTRAPQRLLSRAVSGYAEGIVGAQTIATLRGMTTVAVEDELREAGITPAPLQPLLASAEDLPEVDVDLSLLDGLDDEEPNGVG